MTVCALCPPPDPENPPRTDLRLFPVGRRCPRHTPARIAGRPEIGTSPDPRQRPYCPPGICWHPDTNCHDEDARRAA